MLANLERAARGWPERVCAALLALSVVSCKARVRTLPATEVLLRVDAAAEVRARATQLRIRPAVQPSEAAGWTARPAKTIELEADAAREPWPVDIPLVPNDRSALPITIEIVAQALDPSGELIVEARALTRFIRDQQLVLQVTLERCGDRALGTACEPKPDCHGAGCQTCSAGACADTPFSEPDALSPIDQPGAAADGGRAADSDAGTGPAAGRRAGGAGAGAGGQAPRDQAGSAASSGQGAAGEDGASSQGIPDSGPTPAGREGPAAGSGGESAPPDAGPLSVAPLQWSPSALLETGMANVYGPLFDRNVAGDVFVAWWQEETNGYLWGRRFVHGSWDAEPLRIEGESKPVYDELSPMGVGIDGLGRAQLFFRALAIPVMPGTRYKSYWLPWAGSGAVQLEAPPLVLGDQTQASPTLLATRESGAALALWAGDEDSVTMDVPIYLNARAAERWGTPLQIGTASGHARSGLLDTNEAGDFIAAFLMQTTVMGSDAVSQSLKTFIGRGTAVSAAPVLSVPESVLLSSFFVDGSGNGTLLVQTGPPENIIPRGTTYWSRYEAGAGAWTALAKLTPNETSDFSMELIAARDPVVVWVEDLGSTLSGRLLASRFAGQAWESPRVIHELPAGNIQRPWLSANKAGFRVVVWQQPLGTSDQGNAVMFSQSSDGVDWSQAAVVTTYKGYLDLNGLVVSDDNRALVFWIEYEGSAPADLRWSQGR